MARFVKVPAGAESFEALVDNNGKPVAVPVPWSKFIHAITLEKRFVDGFDSIFAASDCRKKLKDAKGGDVIELTDLEWKVLEPVCKKPETILVEVAYQLEEFFRAVTDAPTKRPE